MLTTVLIPRRLIGNECRGRSGQFRFKRKTSTMKFRASLLRCKEWLQRNRNIPAIILMNPMRVKMLCHYFYYGVTDNYRSLSSFHQETQKLLLKWLNRRSQKKSLDFQLRPSKVVSYSGCDSRRARSSQSPVVSLGAFQATGAFMRRQAS